MPRRLSTAGVELLLIIIVAALVPGFFLLLAGLWAIWLALGRTPVAIRVPVFLLGTIPLGLLGCTFGGGPDDIFPYAGWLALAVLSGAVLERKYIVFSLFCVLIAFVHVYSSFLRGVLNGEWFTTTTIALCALAGLISILRLMGFRLICFATDAISRDIDQASGRDIDQWIVLMDKEGADSWNFAEMMIFLRSYGFDYRWQKAIAIAYEKSLGRRSVDSTFEGKPQSIQASVGWTPPEWFRQFGEHRFSIVQMLLWSVAAATFFGFFRLIGQFAMTTEQIAVGGPVILAMACISIASLQRFLGVRDRRPPVVLILLFAGPCFVAPFAVGIFPGLTAFYAFMAAGLLGYGIWLTTALLLIRQRGYRLVRVQTTQVAVSPSV